MSRPKSLNWTFDLLVTTGGVCSILTIVGLGVSASSYGAWVVSSPFVTEHQEQGIHEFANRSFLGTLPFFASSLAIAATTSYLLDRSWQRLKANEQTDDDQRRLSAIANRQDQPMESDHLHRRWEAVEVLMNVDHRSR